MQLVSSFFPTEQKLAWIRAEAAAGVREIEVTSFVPPKLVPQFIDAEEVVRESLKIPGLSVMALIPNMKGAERGFALGVHQLNFVMSVSRTHSLKNVRRSREESVADLRRIVEARNAQPQGRRPKIIARAHGRSDAFEYLDIGVPAVRELFGSALEAAEAALRALDFGPMAARRVVTRFRRHDEEMLAEQAPHRGEIKALIALQQRGRDDLERLLRSETEAAREASAG